MMRHARVLWLFWSASLAAEMEYRVNFAVAALNSLINLVGSVFTLTLFYQSGYGFDGWPLPAALIVQGASAVLIGLTQVWLRPNLSAIVEHVREGTLDFVLLKPMDSQFWVSLRRASPWGLPDVFFGLTLAGYGMAHLGIGPAGALRGLPILALGVVVLYSLWFMLATMAIWFVKIYNATEVLRSLLDAGRFPMAAYPAAWRLFFTFVVPVAFLTTVPAEAVRGNVSATWVLATVALAAGLLVIARWFWRFALRFYTSASS